MSITTYTPSNPLIATDAGSVGQCLAETFRGSLNAYVAAIEDKAQTIQALAEQLALNDGYGTLSDGGTIAAGTGLAATVGPYSAYIGNVVASAGIGTVALGANATNVIYLYQDGELDLTGTVTAHGASMAWGQAVTNGAAVTSVSNERRFRQRQYGGAAISYSAGGTITPTIAQYAYPLLHFTGTVTGTVVVRMPLQPYAAWDVINAGSAATALCAATGGTVIVATTKAARVACDGTDYRRLTPDT